MRRPGSDRARQVVARVHPLRVRLLPVAGAILACAATLAAPPAHAQALEGKVTRITLDNGMRFLVVRRGTAPVFAAELRFRVGSVDDPGGRSGLAHLFEHLAFKGTSTIGTRDAAKRSEEHTSELQSLAYLVCRLLL